MGERSIRAAVVGAAGYAGSEIVRLLSTHPSVEVSVVTSSRHAGTPLRALCPWLTTELVLSEFKADGMGADIVFLAQETGFAMEHAPALSEKVKVVDLSADFRLTDLDIYEATYKRPRLNPSVKGVYGLPELIDRKAISDARLVANPGCYPTATLLGLMPLIRAGVLAGTPVIDAKSGVSGAGRSRTETDYLFTEIDGGFRAYGVVGHRHTPEIEQMAGLPVRFTPHLLPTPRGLHATIYASVSVDSAAALDEIFHRAYEREAFVQVVDVPPSTKQVVGSNRCDIYATYDPRTRHAVVMSVIDNLVKGAAGQAIQNMNLMLGLPEEAGLPINGVWP